MLLGTKTLTLIPTGKIAELYTNYYNKYINGNFRNKGLKIDKDIMYRTLEDTYLAYSKPYKSKYNVLSLFYYDKEFHNLALENIANKQNDFSQFSKKDFNEYVEYVLHGTYWDVADIIYENSGSILPNTKMVFKYVDIIYRKYKNKPEDPDGLNSTMFNEYKRSMLFADEVYEVVTIDAKNQNPPLYVESRMNFYSHLLEIIAKAEQEFEALNEFLYPKPNGGGSANTQKPTNNNTLLIVGGIALLGVGAYLVFKPKKSKKRK